MKFDEKLDQILKDLSNNKSAHITSSYVSGILVENDFDKQKNRSFMTDIHGALDINYEGGSGASENQPGIQVVYSPVSGEIVARKDGQSSNEFIIKADNKTIRGQKNPFHVNCRTVTMYERADDK